MAFDADPRLYDALWVRNTVPDRRRAVFSLLVDLSGSMSGVRVEAALLGTIVLAETLARLRIPFAIHGFQDVLIPVCRVHEEFGPAVRARIAGMVEEVAGTRPGGNNVPGFNDDGPCVLDAANALLGEPAEDRFLIVVSDGLPAGCRSSDDDLHAAIAALADAPLELLGVGLGEGTEHVATFYPKAIASVPLERFADAMAGAIEAALHADG
jgi:cobaltochelatase CobT